MTSLVRATNEQGRVIRALMLRDMQTRFGRSLFGYLIIVGWPLTHLLVAMGVYLLVRRAIPFGTSAPVFLGTGILPYILCLYPARMTLLSILQNQPLLYFPIIKPFDVIVGRGLMEVITAFWVTTIFCIILFLFGVDIIPVFPEEAILAVLATIYFSFSMGFIGAVLYKIFKGYIAIQVGLSILMYVTSGALFLPSSLPAQLQYYIWFNPLMHSVEWLRSAYYDGYSNGLLSKEYLLGFATALFLLGLISERLLRRYVVIPG